MAGSLWLLRLSITTISPGRRVGTRNCTTQARKLSALMGPSRMHGAVIPSHRNPATKVSVLRWPCGTWATRRWPLAQRPCRRVIFVFAQVSSMKIRRDAQTLPCRSCHCRRRRATSARSCSLARRLFFKAEPGVIQEVPDTVVAHVHTTRVQFPQQFAAGEVRLLCHPLTDPGFLAGQGKWLLATHRQRRRAPRLRFALRPADHRRVAHLIMLRRFRAAHAISHRTNCALPQIKRVGSSHARWPPLQPAASITSHAAPESPRGSQPQATVLLNPFYPWGSMRR